MYLLQNLNILRRDRRCLCYNIITIVYLVKLLFSQHKITLSTTEAALRCSVAVFCFRFVTHFIFLLN